MSIRYRLVRLEGEQVAASAQSPLPAGFPRPGTQAFASELKAAEARSRARGCLWIGKPFRKVLPESPEEVAARTLLAGDTEDRARLDAAILAAGYPARSKAEVVAAVDKRFREMARRAGRALN